MNRHSELSSPREKYYQIRIKESIDPCWSAWIDGFAISYEPNGVSVLCGPVADQAALHGLLARVRDLNLTLISVNPMEEEKPEN